jgi:hypothetical protein
MGLPELADARCHFGKFGSAEGMGCISVSGKLRKTKFQLLTQSLLNQFQHRLGFSTIRTFVIAIFDKA